MKKWHNRFIDLAKQVATWSKDPSTKVGCVLVGENQEVLSTGYNGFPRGANDDEESRYIRPEKYLWTEHAERNAIYNAARLGARTRGCIVYTTLFPCIDCARAIIQCGAKSVVTIAPEDWEHAHLHFEKSRNLLAECGVDVVLLNEED